jgi:quercetin dioxygenase-like cupin family protein
MAAVGHRKDPERGWVRVSPGVEMRGMVEGEGTALVLYRIAPGHRFAAHRHPFPEYGTMIAGRGRLLLDAGPREIREGDSYYMPSGLSHGFQAGADEGPIVMLHVAVGLAAQVRASMFRHLVGRTRSSVRAGTREAIGPEPAEASVA